MTQHETLNTAETAVLAAAQAFVSARQAAGNSWEGAEVQIHKGDSGHRAVQVYGNRSDACRMIAYELADHLRDTGMIRKAGYPAVRCDASIALVWYR